MRLANLIAAPPGELLLEDANELALWRTRPPAYQAEDRIVWQSPVPPLAEWLAEDDEAAGDAGTAGFYGVVGGLLGMGG